MCVLHSKHCPRIMSFYYQLSVSQQGCMSWGGVGRGGWPSVLVCHAWWTSVTRGQTHLALGWKVGKEEGKSLPRDIYEPNQQ
jgi:hypothetical protein